MSPSVPETPRKGVCDSLLNGKHTSSSTLAPLEVDKARKKAAGRRSCLDVFNPLPGVPCSAELCGIGLTYLIFGALDVWGRLPVSFFLKDDLQWSPSQLEFWSGLKTLPWIIQPLYGFLSDAIPLLGYHRRSYIVLLSLMGVGVWTGFSQVRTTAHAIAALMLGSFSEAFSITVVDSVLVTRIHGQSLEFAASLQSFCWGLQAAGKVASASVVGIMVERLKPRSCFFVVALLPLMVACSAFVMQEEAGPVCCFGRGREGQRRVSHVMVEKLRLLKDVFMEKYLLLPALFFFLWQVTPSVDSAVFYFGVNALHFSEHFYGTILLVDGCAQILGVAFYNLFLRRVALKKVFFWTAIALISAHLMQVLLVTGYNRKLGVSDPAYMLISGAIDAGLGRVALMPLVVLAARLCPKGVEATVFGMLIGLHIASHMTGKVLGSALTVLFGVTSSNFANLAPLMLVCAISRFLPLPLLFLLPDKMTREEEARPGDVEKAAVQNIGVGAVEDIPPSGRTSTPVP